MSDIVFDNRVAIVTGAGGGLGRTYALELARRGARVVVNDLGGTVDGLGGESSAADATVAEIIEGGGEAVASYASVAEPDGGKAIVETALETFGTVDVVVNNAGILRDRSFAKMDMTSVHAVIDVHLNGAFHVTQPAFEVMRANNYGRIVFTSSASGIFGNFGQANYGAAKMGLVGLMNVVAIEGAKYNIRSNAVAPVARTRMTEDLLGPMIQYVDPEQVTPMVVYLASDACDTSHEIWTVGGGRFGRVFIGVNEGWFAGVGARPTVEEVHANLDAIRDISSFDVPTSSTEELALLMAKLQA
jgi:NAD(P)-dependent dehydrogenase (short-subunit alcohol dehydrogenase family)